MYECGASQDALEKEDQNVDATRAVPTPHRQVRADAQRVRRRRIAHQPVPWIHLLLLMLCLALVSACDIPGASGTHASTATPGLGGTLAAAATAQAAASANDHPSTVFIAENTGSQGNVLALNTADGSVLWRSKKFAGMMGSLLQAQGVVLVPIDSVSAVSLVALDAQDGTERWHADGLYPNGGMVVDGNTIYINISDTSQQTRVEAHRVTDGSLLWRYTGAACGPNNIAASSGVVVLAAEGCYPALQITALSEPDGKMLWQRPATELGGEIAIANGVIYLNNTGLVTAFDAETGATKWQYTPAQRVGQGGSSVSVGDQMVIAEAGTKLLALRPQDGSVAWNADFHGLITGHVIVGNVVYVTSGATVTALRQSDGVRLWQTPLDLPEPWPPIVANGVLYVSVDDSASESPRPGKLYAIQIADGSVAWQYTSQGGVPLPALG